VSFQRQKGATAKNYKATAGSL